MIGCSVLAQIDGSILYNLVIVDMIQQSFLCTATAQYRWHSLCLGQCIFIVDGLVLLLVYKHQILLLIIVGHVGSFRLVVLGSASEVVVVIVADVSYVEYSIFYIK